MAHHLGIEGVIIGNKYKFLYTYSINYGTNFYTISPEQTQHSVCLNTEITNSLPWNFVLSISIGADYGKFYGNNFGLSVSLIRSIGF
ncbi:MAG: hypothetical protein HC905_29120 [Bacteroidales bacterium]|nr:hypothetical protein [Bacteroidales bacterium]